MPLAAVATLVWWMLQGSGNASGQTAKTTSQSGSGADGQLAEHGSTDLAATQLTQPVIPTVPAPVAPVAIAPAEPAPAQHAKDGDGEFKDDIVWNFTNGPAKGFDVLDGDWKWELVVTESRRGLNIRGK